MSREYHSFQCFYDLRAFVAAASSKAPPLPTLCDPVWTEHRHHTWSNCREENKRHHSHAAAVADRGGGSVSGLPSSLVHETTSSSCNGEEDWLLQQHPLFRLSALLLLINPYTCGCHQLLHCVLFGDIRALGCDEETWIPLPRSPRDSVTHCSGDEKKPFIAYCRSNDSERDDNNADDTSFVTCWPDYPLLSPPTLYRPNVNRWYPLVEADNQSLHTSDEGVGNQDDRGAGVDYSVTHWSLYKGTLYGYATKSDDLVPPCIVTVPFHGGPLQDHIKLSYPIAWRHHQRPLVPADRLTNSVVAMIIVDDKIILISAWLRFTCSYDLKQQLDKDADDEASDQDHRWQQLPPPPSMLRSRLCSTTLVLIQPYVVALLVSGHADVHLFDLRSNSWTPASWELPIELRSSNLATLQHNRVGDCLYIGNFHVLYKLHIPTATWTSLISKNFV